MQVCILCGVEYATPRAHSGDYGLCPGCFSRDKLREVDRLQSAQRRATRAGHEATLTLSEWLGLVVSFRGMCALCEQVPYATLTMWEPSEGLRVGNVAPLCKACSHHHEHGYAQAWERLTMVLQSTPTNNEQCYTSAAIEE